MLAFVQTYPQIQARFMLLRTLASRWNKEMFRCYEAKIEESKKAGSRTQDTWLVQYIYRIVRACGCPVVQLCGHESAIFRILLSFLL